MIEYWPEYRIFEDNLAKFIETVVAAPKIKRALSYAISAGGKRSRPLIVLLCGKLCGGDYGDVMNLAISVELIHTASLVHDDVIDRAEKRRKKDALHKKYDITLAIVLGDWLISKSVELTSEYGEEIIRDFSKVGMMMSEGEVLDFYSIKEPFDEKDYFECIEKKTAALFAYSARSACKIVSDDKKAAEKLYQYGLNLGLAYQIVDDMLEYMKILEDKHSEFESRTLPQIYEEKYGKSEVISRTIEKMGYFAEKSLGSLEYFEDGVEREKLEQIVNYMTYDMIKRHSGKRVIF
ncbi:polyprenyl synthetase family protein [Archaeoglobus neptunius]|uniref:polyprenyl synthetase family protein n=1 Tax=Archaeoglobus neptunius TaxID=2798580 RepID=UPI001926BD9B